MPIHQTKLMMSKRPADRDVDAPDADALDEQVAERRPAAASAAMKRDAEADEPAERRRAASRTIALILSVTEPNVWPGAMTGGASASATAAMRIHRVSCPSRLGHVARAPGSGCAAPPDTSCAAACSARRAARSCAARPCSLRHAAVRIVQVAEDDRVGRAGLLAGGHDLAVADRAVLALRRRSRAWLMRCTQ